MVFDVDVEIVFFECIIEFFFEVDIWIMGYEFKVEVFDIVYSVWVWIELFEGSEFESFEVEIQVLYDFFCDEDELEFMCFWLLLSGLQFFGQWLCGD